MPHSRHTLSIYVVDASTGKLRHNGYALTGTAPTSVAVDPSGRFVYVANNGTIVTQTGGGGSGAKQTGIVGPGGGSVSVYTINQTTGALTPGTAVAAGTNPALIAVDPSVKFAYVANWGSNTVSVYSIDQTTGARTAGTAVAAGINPAGVAVDPSGRFAYVTNQTSNNVYVYTIDQTAGALTQVGAPVAAGAEPFRITTVSMIQ